MVEFLFICACVVFISTITWLSYKLAQTKSLNANISCTVGFVLAFLPPIALFYIGFLAFRDDAPNRDPRMPE